MFIYQLLRVHFAFRVSLYHMHFYVVASVGHAFLLINCRVFCIFFIALRVKCMEIEIGVIEYNLVLTMQQMQNDPCGFSVVVN